MSQALVLRFGQEELIYLLRALRLESVGDVTRNSLGSLDDDHKALALAVADRSLRARGVIHWTSAAERDVEATAADVLRACSQPQYTLVVDMRDEQPATVWVRYAFAAQRVIEQSEPEPGVYQFIASGDRNDLLNRISTITRFENAAEAHGPAQPLSRALFDSALTAASQDREHARQTLARELHGETAALLADTMAANGAMRSIVFVQTSSAGQGTRQAIVALQGQHHVWIAEGPDDREARWTITPGSDALLRARLEAVLEPALRTLSTGSASTGA